VSESSEVRALVVEDEAPLADLIRGYLVREGFVVDVAGDGETAVTLAHERRPDIVLLDLMLPGIDGLEVCRRIRRFSDAYVIMLTAKAEEVDTVVGLSLGADDYVTKPFSPRELVARVRAVLRRPRVTGEEGGSLRRIGDLVVDATGHEVRQRGRLVDLTRTEFDLLDALSAHPQMAFSRRQLLERVWGTDWYGDDHVVDVHIANLRRKLGDDASSPRYIRTVRGVGYRMGTG
jgi:DNA-binding response OmpR family regulator